jgi:hypothetical protein
MFSVKFLTLFTKARNFSIPLALAARSAYKEMKKIKGYEEGWFENTPSPLYIRIWLHSCRCFLCSSFGVKMKPALLELN